MITHEEALALFRYDPLTGDLFWNAPRPRIRVGQKAGYLNRKGYVNLEIYGKHCAAHRLIWLYVTGSMPTKQIDHINGDKSDNRFQNLRLADNGQNRANSKSTNKHGLKGLLHRPWLKKNPWQAQIRHNKKQIYLGCFPTKEEAHEAYCKAAKDLHGEFFHP